jgi:hypothetical protein
MSSMPNVVPWMVGTSPSEDSSKTIKGARHEGARPVASNCGSSAPLARFFSTVR